MHAIMIQGTGSNIGKSLLVAGLCRAFRARGLKVAPFKPQNMSNNAAPTADGGEVGRAQALQALACGMEPTSDMNPVLLKPESDTGAQIIVQGRPWRRAEAGGYSVLKPQLLGAVRESFARLQADADLVVVEGAGSAAEVNLRKGDIANMGFARAESVPVILAGDIDRGGVIAQLVGTRVVIDPADNALIRGFIINKFRGDPALFRAGYADIAQRTGWEGMGVLPWFDQAHLLPAEDAQDLHRKTDGGQAGLHVVCLAFSRIANFDDLDPLAAEAGIRLTMLRAGQAVPGDADLVILPDTRSPRSDLAFLRAQGWDVDLAAHLRRKGAILGLGGGYLMLGKNLADPGGVDGPAGDVAGLGWLDVEAVLTGGKQLVPVNGRGFGADLSGHRANTARISGADTLRPFADIAGQPEGAINPDGRVMGTGLQGMFGVDGFRAAFLRRLGAETSGLSWDAQTEVILDRLGVHMEAHLQLDRIAEIAGL